MPITPFRARINAAGNSPGWLRDGTGGRFQGTFGLMLDCRLERLVQGTMARMPRSTIAGWTAPLDAQQVIAGDRLLLQGLTESRASLAARNQGAFTTWQLAGLPRTIMANVNAYLLALMPEIRTVAASYDRSTWPPTRLGTTWTTYAAGATTTTPPVVAFGTNGGAGDWDWDSASPITGSWGWWSGYMVLYAVAPNAWCQPAQNWGTGSTYTASGDGYYSTITGGAYVDAGSYAGTTQTWGAGGTYAPSATTTYYSTIANGAYVAAGIPSGPAQGWGVSVSVYYGAAFTTMARQFKPANVWIRSLIVSFYSTLFDPAHSADNSYNPGGGWGQWSTVGGGQYGPTRFSGAVYGGSFT